MDCGRRLFKAYICTDCNETFHRHCGKFFKKKDSTQFIQICLLCQQLPAFATRYPDSMRTRSGSHSSTSSKKCKSNAGSSDSDSQDSDTSEPKAKEPTLKDVLRCSKSTKRVVSNLSMQFNQFVLSSKESDVVQASHTIALKKHDEKFRVLEANIPHELIFAGHLESENPNADLKQIVINIANFLGIQVAVGDIRKTRLLKQKIQQKHTTSAPIVATFYSYSDCLKILDAKKDIKIFNSNVIVNSNSQQRIYINQMLPQELFLLLKKCKNWASKNSYKYVWHHQGEILIKRDDTELPLRINNEADLNSLSNNQPPNINVSHVSQVLPVIASTSTELTVGVSTNTT